MNENTSAKFFRDCDLCDGGGTYGSAGCPECIEAIGRMLKEASEITQREIQSPELAKEILSHTVNGRYIPDPELRRAARRSLARRAA